MSPRAAPHVLAVRETIDDRAVVFWSDGWITDGEISRARTVRVHHGPPPGHSKADPMLVAWLVAGEVSLYTAKEIPALVRAARKAVQTPADGGRAPTPVAAWEATRGRMLDALDDDGVRP